MKTYEVWETYKMREKFKVSPKFRAYNEAYVIDKMFRTIKKKNLVV